MPGPLRFVSQHPEGKMMFDLNSLVRPNVRRMRPYSSARSEFAGEAEVFLDANENAYGSPAGGRWNRYPDPRQSDLKNKISAMRGVAADQIFIGNGSDEAIDLLFRIFCEPGVDECIICPPTYGMYQVSADLNDVAVREAGLTGSFQLDTGSILAAANERSKLIFICSPNNPTGNLMRRDDVLQIARAFRGIVVIDEAYIDFANEPSMIAELGQLPNIVVLQTFSKAWGMAGLRVGMAFSNREMIGLFDRVKPPYNVSGIAQSEVADSLSLTQRVESSIANIINERRRMARSLSSLDCVNEVFPSDANFLLVRTTDAAAIYSHLVEQKIVVRDRSRVTHCEGCLRITIGTPAENDRLLSALAVYPTLQRPEDELLPILSGGI